MAPLRFVHAADLHLDSPFRGIARLSDRARDVLVNATFEAFEQVVALCREEEVDALLVAGDVFDGAERSLRAERRFRDRLGALARDGIPSFVVHGNHDPVLDGTRLDGWPSGVTVFGPEVGSAPILRDGDEIGRVYGASFGRGGFATNLVRRFPSRGLTDEVAIGLCHATVGTRPDHGPWAPCTADDLIASGYDYWALGHVHTREVVRDAGPVVVYPGNPQGRHRRESGPRGCALVELEGGEADVRFVDTDVVRWVPLAASIDDLADADALGRRLLREIDRLVDAADGRSLAITLTLEGRGPLHRLIASPTAVRALLADVEDETSVGGRIVVIESVVSAVRPALDLAALRERASLAGEVLRVADGVAPDPAPLDELFAPLESRLAEVGRARPEPDPIDDDRRVRAMHLAIDLLDEEESG